MRVLIADDSATLRERLAEMLSEIQGVNVVGSAADAQGAIDLIRQARPDVVLLDIRLRDSSGFEVLQSIKRWPHRSPVTIVLTNYAFPQYQREYMAAGADYFFDKSIEIEKLTDVLKRMIKIERNN